MELNKGKEISYKDREGCHKDHNFVLTEIHRLTNIEPNAYRFWQGEKETALYFFGDSFDKMNDSISEFINTYPLCKGARVVKIA